MANPDGGFDVADLGFLFGNQRGGRPKKIIRVEDLERCKGYTRKAAAEALGVSESTLRRRIQELGYKTWYEFQRSAGVDLISVKYGENEQRFRMAAIEEEIRFQTLQNRIEQNPRLNTPIYPAGFPVMPSQAYPVFRPLAPQSHVMAAPQNLNHVMAAPQNSFMYSTDFGGSSTQVPMVSQSFPQMSHGSQPQAQAHFTDAYNMQFMQPGSSSSVTTSKPDYTPEGAAMSQQWFFHSGATNHITNSLHNLAQAQPAPLNDGIMIGNGTNLQVTHTGQEHTNNSVSRALPQGAVSHSELL